MEPMGTTLRLLKVIPTESKECPCTAEQLARVSGGLMISGRSPIQSTQEPW